MQTHCYTLSRYHKKSVKLPQQPPERRRRRFWLLISICEKYGFSADAVRRQVDTEAFEPKDVDMELDRDTYDEMMTLFEIIMQRAE